MRLGGNFVALQVNQKLAERNENKAFKSALYEYK